RLEDGRLFCDGEGWTTEVVRDELVHDYNSTAKPSCTAQELRNHLVKVLPPSYPQDGPRLTVDAERKRTWIFPSLTECRRHFQNQFGLTDPWPEELIKESQS